MADTKMQLVDWLDDLCSRFILNLPKEELESVERICFQVEEAQWFYEDFIRPLDPTLPSLNLKQFCLVIFRHCPFFAQYSQEQYMAAYDEFLSYKIRVPVRGAIMLDETMQEVILVKGWKKGANWSFPRGKINKDESDIDCAIREVYEETGFDIAAAGLVPDPEDAKFIEVSLREQHMKLFVFRGVPREANFQPRTRKEISKISWYRLANLPGYSKKLKLNLSPEETVSANKLYMVAPFLGPLKKWINEQRRHATPANSFAPPDSITHAFDDFETDGNVTADDQKHMLPPAGNTAESSSAADELKRLLFIGSETMPSQPSHVPQIEHALPRHQTSLLHLITGNAAAAEPAVVRASAPTPAIDASRADDAFFEQSQAKPTSERQHTTRQQSLLDLFKSPAATPPPSRTVPQSTRFPSVADPHAPVTLSAAITGREASAAIASSDTANRHNSRSVEDYTSAQPVPLAVAPQASALPAPRLSSHAQSLLNLFHGSQRQPDRPQPVGAKASITLQPSSIGPRRRSSQNASGSALNQLSLQDDQQGAKTQAASVRNKLPLAGASYATSSLAEEKHALLDIFKGNAGPNNPAQFGATQENRREQQGRNNKSVAPERPPNETPRTGNQRKAKSLGIATEREDKPPQIKAILQRPKQSEVTQPHLSPDFSQDFASPKTPQLRSRPTSSHHLPSPVKDSGADQSRSNSRRSAKRTSQTKARIENPVTPVQILKRPQPPKIVEESKGPDTAHVTLNAASHDGGRSGSTMKSEEQYEKQSSDVAVPASKPFQPQILKRPQQQQIPAVSSLSHDRIASPTRDVKDLTQLEHTRSLLSLLGARRGPNIADGAHATHERSEPTAATLESSPSEQKEMRNDGRDGPKIIGQNAEAKDNQIAAGLSHSTGLGQTIQSETQSEKKVSPITEIGSPISSADKGFLLNFLDNVVRGAAKDTLLER